MRILVRNRRRQRGKTGLSLIEVTVAIAVLVTGLMASAQALAKSITVVTEAQRTHRAAVFLETVMEDLAAQPYESLLAFNGNRLIDGDTQAESSFAVELSVFQAGIDLLQVRATLLDGHGDRPLGSVVTLRTRR